jgi:hypothetical protein
MQDHNAPEFQGRVMRWLFRGRGRNAPAQQDEDDKGYDTLELHTASLNAPVSRFLQ